MNSLDKAIKMMDDTVYTWVGSSDINKIDSLLNKAVREKNIKRHSELMNALKGRIKALETSAKSADDLGERRALRQALAKANEIYKKHLKVW